VLVNQCEHASHLRLWPDKVETAVTR
jgi:hypothetical protein